MNFYSLQIKCQLRIRMQITFVYWQAFTNPDYLAIPASEVAVERLFNSGTDLLGPRRHYLSADTMRELVLLRDM
ncbi:hypothetical protein V1517DRAFT_334848, partial [Lipomyces orientalis]